MRQSIRLTSKKPRRDKDTLRTTAINPEGKKHSKPLNKQRYVKSIEEELYDTLNDLDSSEVREIEDSILDFIKMLEK